MTWFKVDDKFPMHGKVKALRRFGARVRADAIALWTLSGCGCAGALSDGGVVEGHVSPEDVEATMYPTKPADSLRAAEALVAVGLWHKSDDGYMFHDWQEYQPTAADVKSERERWRKSKAKSRGRPPESSHGQPDVPPGHSRDSTACPETPVPVPVPTIFDGGETPPPDESAFLRDIVTRRWAVTYEATRGTLPARDDKSAREVVAWLCANATNVGRPVADLLNDMLAAYWREEWPRAKGNRPSLRNLLGQLDRLLVAHRDAKPENVSVEEHMARLVREQEERNAKIYGSKT